MTPSRDRFHKWKYFVRFIRSQDHQGPYKQATIASQTQASMNAIKDTPFCELEAIEKMDISEMDGANWLHDQDAWLGSYVWKFFIIAKFVESKPTVGLSPGLPEFSQLLHDEFDSPGAITRIVEADPHLIMSSDRSTRHALLKALGLAVKSTSFDPSRIMTIMNILTPFCPCNRASASQNEDIATAVTNETSSPPPATDLTERHSPSPPPATDLAERHSPSPPPATDLAERHSASPPLAIERPEYHQSGDAQKDTEQNHDDPEYTTALKERGDTESCSPHSYMTSLSLEPPRWSAVVEYKAFRSSAEGSTKKAAKHSASKALWLQMTGSSVI